MKAKNGTVIYIPCGLDYLRVTEENEELIAVHLQVYGDNANGIESFSDALEVQPIFETMLRRWERGDKNGSTVALYELFAALEKKLKPENGAPISIQEGVRRIEREFRDPSLTVAELSRRCHVSAAYFRRAYKEHFGISPIQALIEKRFGYARELLRAGYYQIKEIAEMSGFSDVKYFRTAFTERYGVSPTEYAKRFGSEYS